MPRTGLYVALVGLVLTALGALPLFLVRGIQRLSDAQAVCVVLLDGLMAVGILAIAVGLVLAGLAALTHRREKAR